MSEIQKYDVGWYKQLIDDLKKIEFAKMVFGWFAVGDRIIKDYDKFDKAEWGNKRVENIAKDMGYGRTTVFDAINFARTVHKKLDVPENEYITFEKLSDRVGQLGIEDKTWKDITHDWLVEKPREPKPVTGIIQHEKYNIIYADPPWKYFEGGHHNQSQQYDTMELEDICHLEVNGKSVAELGADDSLLFLWVTYPMLDNFMDVLRCWGYEYSTVGFTWIKANRSGEGFFFGLGNWTRANAEICVIGRRGSIKRQDNTVFQIVYTPMEKHSKKPAVVRDRIVQLVGDLPRIELFARQKTEGWDVWGNQI